MRQRTERPLRTRASALGAFGAAAALVLSTTIPAMATSEGDADPDDVLIDEIVEDEAAVDDSAEIVIEVETPVANQAPETDAEVAVEPVDVEPSEPEVEVAEPETAPEAADPTSKPAEDATEPAAPDTDEPIIAVDESDELAEEPAEASVDDAELPEGTESDESAEATDDTADETAEADEVTISAVSIEPMSINDFWLNPTTINQSDLLFRGVSIWANGLVPNSDVTITVDGVEYGTFQASTAGWLEHYLYGDFEPGVYTIGIETEGVQESAELTVEAGGFDILFFLDDFEIAEWDLSNVGLGFWANGFPPNEEIEVVINGDVVDTATADEFGLAETSFTANLAPGNYDVTVRSPAAEAAESFDVISNGDAWDPDLYEPWVGTSTWVVTESEIAETPIEVIGRDFPSASMLEVLLNGVVIDTVETEPNNRDLNYILHGPLDAGTYAVTLSHPAAEGSVEFDVVPDEQGNPPHTGDYPGTSIQTHAGSTELDSRDQRPFSLAVDSDGNLTDVTGEYWWACRGVGGITGSGFAHFENSEFVPTPITIDRPFEIHWSNNVTDYMITGTVRADGSASGMIFTSQGVCGGSTLSWSTELDGDVPDPDPGPEPEPTVVEAEAPTQDGNTVTIPVVEGVTYIDGADAVITGSVTLSEGQTLNVTATADDEYVLADGVHSWTFEYEATDPDPEPEPVDPEEGDLDPALEGAISAPATAEAGDTVTVQFTDMADGTEVDIWFFSDPIHLGTPVVTEGSVQVVIPAGAENGDHTIAAWDGQDQIGWTTINITSDDGTDPEPTPDPEPEPEVVEAEEPGRDGNTVLFPTIEGVSYVDGDGNVLTGEIMLVEGQTLVVTAVAEEGYELAGGVTEWTFGYEATEPDPEPTPDPTPDPTDPAPDPVDPDPTDPVDPEPTDPGDDNGGNGDGSGNGGAGDGTGSRDGDGSGTGGSTEPTTPATGPDGALVALSIMALLLAGGAILVITNRRLNALK